MSSSTHLEKDLDIANINRGVWLVKVPKYIAKKWEKAPGNIEVAKLKIVKPPKRKADVTLRLSEALLAMKEPGEEDIPKQHKLDVSQITNQTLGIFSHTTPNPNSESVIPETEKLCMEGKIVQKLECRPFADNTYMKLKLESIRKAATPRKKLVKVPGVVYKFKPVSNHKHNIEYAKKKKAEGKRVRDDNEKVQEMLFAAFEKHQYYSIKDLSRITKQPLQHLASILNEYCNKNLKKPHRNMYELKPEYCHYKKDVENAESSKEKTDK